MNHCPHCKGTGAIIPWAEFGMEMRLKRVRAKVGSCELAKRLGYSQAWVSKLELEGKPWPKGMAEMYLQALSELTGCATGALKASSPLSKSQAIGQTSAMPSASESIPA